MFVPEVCLLILFIVPLKQSCLQNSTCRCFFMGWFSSVSKDHKLKRKNSRYIADKQSQISQIKIKFYLYHIHNYTQYVTCSKIERFQSNENIVLDIAKVPTVRNREKYTKLVFIQKVSQSCIGKNGMGTKWKTKQFLSIWPAKEASTIFPHPWTQSFQNWFSWLKEK